MSHDTRNPPPPALPAPPAAVPSSVAALRRFVRTPEQAQRETCDLCGQPLTEEHAHLVEPETRRIVCACDACALLFSEPAEQRFRRVPRDPLFLPDFQLSTAQWDSLRIPIGLAFFFRSSPLGKFVAIYPSPAGPTESLLDLDAWGDIVRDNPVLETMESDTQALLVNRIEDTRDHYLAPIDQCYILVGLIRTHWRGLSGGEEVWTEISRFFDRLQARSRPPTTPNIPNTRTPDMSGLQTIRTPE